jgi:hypothetical protein
MLTYSRKIERYKKNECPQCAKEMRIIRVWTQEEPVSKNCDTCKISWKFDEKKKDVVVNWDWNW